MIKLSKEICHYLLNRNVSITTEYLPVFSTEYTSRFSDNRSIRFPPMPLATSIYSLSSKSTQSGDGCNDTNLEHWSSKCISLFSLISRVLLKIKQGRVPLLILTAPVWSTQPWYPELLNLCFKEPVLLSQGKEILISPKSIVHPLMVENSLKLVAWLVSEKPFRVMEFQKTFFTLLQIPDEQAHSLIMRRLVLDVKK